MKTDRGMTCPYCQESAPLFRVVESYPYGKEYYLHVDGMACTSRDDDCAARIDVCHNCPYEPFLPYNNINISIAIEDNLFVYADAYRPDGKLYFPIRYCPVCGRRLGETRDSETMGSLWEKMITGK